MGLGRVFSFFIAFITTLILCGCGLASASPHPLPHPASPTARLVKSPTPTLSSSPTPARHANPVRLLIPAIGVNAPIEEVGVTSNGNLAVPTQNPWEGVGWYAAGSHPGERGSAVIDGHVDRPGGYSAVFWYLRDLHKGDEVLVTDAHGNTLRVSVTGVAFYYTQYVPVQEIFGNGIGDFLNLITCA